ncbi:hypothetical protein BH23ACT2_BH23ACT2_12230 [soil metagenome]
MLGGGRDQALVDGSATPDAACPITTQDPPEAVLPAQMAGNRCVDHPSDGTDSDLVRLGPNGRQVRGPHVG